MKRSRRAWLIGIILLVAFVLRFYKLGEIPNGLYQDETAIGYNAYSVLTTGRDEHNVSWPLYFKSFGDQKLPIYIYATALSIKAFGLNGFAVRFPSALFGFFSVILFYLYIRAISKNYTLAIVATALLAINPWHVFYSRASFEVSIALFFFLAGALFIHRSFSKPKSGILPLAVLCFLVSFYSYNLTRLLSPLLFVFLFFLYKKQKNIISKADLVVTSIISIIGFLPFIFSITHSGGIGSANGTLITSSATTQASIIEFRSFLVHLPSLFTKISFNTYILTFWQYVTNIASYFSVPFFFITGSSHGNHGISTSGQFFLVEFPLFIIGLYALVKEKIIWARHLYVWGFTTIGVAALTREAPHATRSFFLIIPVITITAWGLISLYSYWSNSYKTLVYKCTAVFLCLLALWNVLYYFSSYYVRFPVAYAKSWRFADKELSFFIKNEENKYTTIIFDKPAGFIYTSLLFYTGYSPDNFQTTAQWAPDDSEGFSQLLSFGKYQFRDVDWGSDYGSGKKTLIITTPDRKPQNALLLKNFYYPKKPVVFALKQEIIRYPVEEIAYVAVATP